MTNGTQSKNRQNNTSYKCFFYRIIKNQKNKTKQKVRLFSFKIIFTNLILDASAIYSMHFQLNQSSSLTLCS